MELIVGDKVRVVNYGSLIWDCTGSNPTTTDISEGAIGKEGVVVKISESGKYAVDGIPEKYAWYNDDQLELIKE